MSSKEQQKKDFEAVFPSLVEDLKENAKQYGIPADALKWYEDVSSSSLLLPPPSPNHAPSLPRMLSMLTLPPPQSLKHNSGGKLNRGLAVPDSAAHLLSSLTPQQYHDTATLGWLTEFLQAFFLVSDDIMDSSTTRRGKPCWYRLPNVGMVAINDAFMLQSSIYVLLKKYFKSHPAYVEILELFHEVTFQTEIGQLCDLITAPEDNVDLSKFSPEKHHFIVVYKTAYYSFYLPVALALHYCQLATPKNLKQAHDILIPTGEYFQVQDDYLDCYGAEADIGKKGTDIVDNKCGWVINEALEHANPQQRKLLDECYGRKDDEKEAEVKKVFNELKLDEAYHEYEENVIKTLRTMVEELDESEGLKRGVFTTFIDKIYKRSK